MDNFIYALLAILGLGFLVFIHELGHFWIARRQGMRVEAFSIGFGIPIYTWNRKGVKWMICILPFGGYVRIAGMQKEGGLEPYEISDGFYAKSPWQRIKVAVAGPLVNIIFSFAIFVVLWAVGGRDKQFSEFTNKIGWVSPQSHLYQAGIRPGDVIERYDGKDFHGFKDLFIASILSNRRESTRLEGYKFDYGKNEKSYFDYTLAVSEDLEMDRKNSYSVETLFPASYLIYDNRDEVLSGSPIAESGIQHGDRILWVDGEMVFSIQQLSALTNQSTSFLTIQRGDQILGVRVPRVQLNDLKMTPSEKAEIGDLQYEAGLDGKVQDLYFIPYNLSPNGKVESDIQFVDPEDQKGLAADGLVSNSLEEGDSILAVDGIPFESTIQFLKELQTRKVLLIIQRSKSNAEKVLWTQADHQFDDFQRKSLTTLVASIGTKNFNRQVADFVLLQPVVPKTRGDLMPTTQQESIVSNEFNITKKAIESIKDPVKRNAAIQQLEATQKKLVLGVPLRDRAVVYNPSPLDEFRIVLVDTWRTLSSLFSGNLHPKHMSGPIGIIHVVQQGWSVGVQEALFWMAVISLNLGVVNLLPLPVLDGGHIVFACVEIVRKKPLRSQTMEKLIIPFIGILISVFLYITYQDIMRIFSKFL